jgi:hypothetical protein
VNRAHAEDHGGVFGGRGTALQFNMAESSVLPFALKSRPSPTYIFVCEELIDKAHLVSLAAITRAKRWAGPISLMYESQNFLACAAAVRGPPGGCWRYSRWAASGPGHFSPESSFDFRSSGEQT